MRPMLATPCDPESGLPRDGARWAYEVKWDGMRVLADLHEGRLRLTSRTGRDVTVAFPELAPLAEAHPDALLDGEVIVLQDGVPSFGALADRFHVTDPRRARTLAAGAPATLIVFDVLRLYGVDLTGRAWQERREVLERMEPSGTAWQLSPIYDDVDALVRATLEQGLEGVVAKRRQSRYGSGARTGDWVKLAHQRTQACLVGGWRPETGTRQRIGALLLGVRTGGAGDADGGSGAGAGGRPVVLHYRGKVGSGIGGAVAAELAGLLKPLATDASPFGTEVPRVDANGAVWVRPEVVVEVRYLRRTEGGRLRAPVFRGVRTDLDPADVRDE
jgi:bifunctional non-homologous end joining protein LigD